MRANKKQLTKQLKKKPLKKKVKKKHSQLVSWKRGQSGNPNGRPKKGNAWADIFNELLDSKGIDLSYTVLIEGKEVKKRVLVKATGKTSIRYALCAKAIQEGATGDILRAIDLLANRTVGKPQQYTEIFIPEEGSPLSDKEKARLADALDNNTSHD